MSNPFRTIENQNDPKHVMAAKAIGLDPEGLSDNAIRYLTASYEMAFEAFVMKPDDGSVDLREFAADYLMSNRAEFAEKVNGPRNAGSAAFELDSRPNVVQLPDLGLPTLPYSYYMLAIAARLIRGVAERTA